MVTIQDIQQNEDEHIAKVVIYQRGNGLWTKEQFLEIKSDCYFKFRVKVGDYNNDGYNDITLVTGQAARDANELRTLLLFNKKMETFIPIRNSQDYPNLTYNSKRNCVEAWSFSAGVTTTFLEIQGDSIIKLASVDYTGGVREVNKFDKIGSSILLSRDSIKEVDDFPRYCNYDPVEVYSE